ncbi:ABC transporter substrate-binding protein [Streptomyces fulvoviolaceus]|uniref:ABC transporter substrate-binding protein n=1 Tax=Streptomyces fulvoviolaceus TaxID=285535 RepID=UPI0004C6751C|nr:ABC transporter substrate-binding protein [Streptomyces fulvoviolaceus]
MAGRGFGTWLREGVWEIPLRRYLGLLFTLVVLGGLSFAVRTLAHDDRACAAGVVKPEGSDECVGVSATAYSWGRPQLRDAVRAIDRENKSIKGDYVTVALLEPFTATDADNLGDVLHELQGAYLAQYQANHLSNGAVPAIRLVLANPGATGAHWKHTVDQLEGMTGGEDRLRAVAGIGLSTVNNEKAVKSLTARGIAVIGTSITADSLANGQNGKNPFPGLARVAPTNSDEARALTSFAKVTAGKAVLVYDEKADDKEHGDPYAWTLQQSFQKLLKGSPYAPWSFNPPDDRSEEGSTPNDFEQITHLVCDTGAGTDTILFAGRHTQLRQFINALGERGCQQRKFTLLTGDEGSYLTGDKDLDWDALRHNLTVRYTALAHPDAWVTDPPSTGGSADDAKVLRELVREGQGDKVGPIGRIDLEDGQLIIAYDAMRLTYQGIRYAKGDGKTYPTLEEVRTEWRFIKGTQQRVNGASGWICLDNHGNPYDKAVPIVELTPEGRAKFVKIAWPEGKPPAKECLPPS